VYIKSILKKIKLNILMAKFYFFLYKIGFISLPNINYDLSKEVDFSLIKVPDRHNNDIPKILWMYWDGSEDGVKFFLLDIIKRNPEWQINVVKRSNLEKYLPEFNIDSLDMPLANITDLIRLELLYKYGGVWIDYTTILTREIEFFLDIPHINNYDIVGYYRKVSTLYDEYPAMESWFLASPKGGIFVKKCLNEFNLVKEIGSADFFKLIRSRADFDLIKQNIHPLEYLIVYLVFQIVMRYEHVNCYLKMSDNSAFLVQDTLGWRAHKSTVYYLMKDKDLLLSPIYKFTSGDRQYFDIIMSNNFINPNSVLGSIVSKSEF